MTYKKNLLFFLLSLILFGCGGGDEPTIQSTPKIEINATVIDGYLKDAKVWLDINENFEFDVNEPFAVSGARGKVVLDVTGIDNPSSYPIVAQAVKDETIDESTGDFVTHNYVISAPKGEVSITPLSTLVHLYLEQNTNGVETPDGFSSKLSEAKDAVASSLGLNKDDVLGDYIEGRHNDVLYAAENIVASGVLPDEPSLLDNISNEITDSSQFSDDMRSVNENIKQSIEHVKSNDGMSFEEHLPVYNPVEQDKECRTGFVQDGVICVVDSDNDAIANNIDTDDDNDGIPDVDDTYPLTVEDTTDTGTDGIGNNSDTDNDNTVIPANVIPVANAGNNQTVDEQTAVTLSGSATDTDGTIAIYSWVQISGTTVLLNNANSVNANFISPTLTVSETLTFSLKAIDNEVASANDSISVTVDPVNSAPTVNVGSDQTVDEQKTVTLSGSATDSDGTIATYSWVQTGGTTVSLTDASSASARFTAPILTVSETLTFSLKAIDNEGASANDSIIVTVDSVNSAPTVNVGSDQTADEQKTVTLSGSATDSDGTIATYSWVQTGGTTVSLTDASSASASFTAPILTAAETLTFSLKAIDNEGASANDSISVTVESVNSAPTVNVGSDQTVDEQKTVTLSGSATDSDGTIATYSWVQTGGTTVSLTDASSASASFTAPILTAAETLTFSLKAIDNEGGSANDSISVTVNPVNSVKAVYSSVRAFAVLKDDGSVVTWGDRAEGGDSSYVTLDHIQTIYSNRAGFAALKDDGSVVTWGWGWSSIGGDSSYVTLENVQTIYSNRNVFAALKDDGSVVTWGSPDWGGDSSNVTLENIQTIYSNERAFAALKDDGSVVTWGYSVYGGDSSYVTLDHVQTIYSTSSAFAALKNDGSVVTWGYRAEGGDSSTVTLNHVQTIYSNRNAFAALKDDGSVVTWGRSNSGGYSSSVTLDHIETIYSNYYAFAALKDDGSVVTWGEGGGGGDSSTVTLDHVQTINSTKRAFAALKDDGSVVTWGEGGGGGDSSTVTLENVQKIYSTDYAFAALKDDGSVVTWGDSNSGGDSSTVTLENVQTIYSTSTDPVRTNVYSGAFAALKDDGSVVTWGGRDSGGDSSSVSDELSP
ncbi:PKD domain containing protein [Psychromonas ingrahamii 37]|uniref:PKD domain containing protein n=1 Tax=Psychromonas ingrahamii (strain DSM 17664 / CCUG 51855 / 37) TaxID=357804 RepID=A1SXS0_PSYIN|nr:PKD domain-containing protein [Psychromonas ingrahamii]ABM04285.1 PKD domain containing protein [Psychromonas ingrahamii 37]